MTPLGAHTRTLDGKRRLVIPAEARQRLGDPFVIAPAPDHTLLLLSLPLWRRENGRRRIPARLRLARSVMLNTDGRVQLGVDLAEWAGLRAGDDVVIHEDGGGRLRVVGEARFWREVREGEAFVQERATR